MPLGWWLFVTRYALHSFSVPGSKVIEPRESQASSNDVHTEADLMAHPTAKALPVGDMFRTFQIPAE